MLPVIPFQGFLWEVKIKSFMNMKTKLRTLARSLSEFHGRMAKKAEGRGWKTLTFIVAGFIIVAIFAQKEQEVTTTPGVELKLPSKSKSRYSRVFPYSHRDEFTTTCEITVAAREGANYTYPKGTKVRILFSAEEKNQPIENRINRGPASRLARHKILIGETQEQIIVPTEVLAELGGTDERPMEARSTQAPAWISTVNKDGPQGFIWTGSPTGDEDVPSSDPAGEQLVFQKLNALRKSKGLNTLVWDEDLARGARYLAGDWYVQEHGCPHWTADTILDPQARNDPTLNVYLHKNSVRVELEVISLLRFCPTAQGANWGGSNREGNFRGPVYIFNSWQASKGHYESMIRPTYRKAAIGNVGTAWIMAFGD